MSLARWSVSLAAVIGVLAAMVAGATIWLLMTDPIRGADTVSAATAGDIAPFMRAIGTVILDALRDLFKYL
jgi:hypothetical protein